MARTKRNPLLFNLITAWTCSTVVFFPSPTLAQAPLYNAPKLQEPKTTSAQRTGTAPKAIDTEQSLSTQAPPTFPKRVVMDQFVCKREVIYRGEKLTCDSHLQPDGEQLRSILAKSPRAIEELNLYQSRRKNLNNLTYVGSLGLAIAGLGLLSSRVFLNPSDYPNGDPITRWTLPIGLGMAGMSFASGWVLLQLNEEHLTNAIQKYNLEYPHDSIQIKFSTTFQF